MAVGCGEGVGGVHEGEHGFVADAECALQHAGYLLLAGTAVSGNGLLDLERGIFVDGYVAADGGGNGYALCTAQLEHALYVLAEEGCLYGHFVGQVLLDDAPHTLVDTPQLQIGVSAFPQVYDAHDLHLHALAAKVQDAVAQDVGAGVDA